MAISERFRKRAASIPYHARRILSIDVAFLVAGIVLAVILRLVLLEFKSLDYFASLKPWYTAIRGAGFAVFATDFSTYNPPYLYLLYLIARFLPDLPIEAAVKLPSLIADFVCAITVFFIVRSLVPHRRTLPHLAGLAVLFAPTVFLNSAFWGQADSIFTSGLLACVYFLIRRQPVAAVLGFSIALAFKLQAIFLLPMLVAMTMQGRIPWKTLLLIPLLLFLAAVPAWLAGRPVGELVGVYAFQASQFESLTMNAPTVFALVPETRRVFNLLYVPGILFGVAVGVAWFTLVLKSRRPMQGSLVAEVALVSLLVIPLVLPKMHERYFFPADVLSIGVAFLFPELFLVPIVVVGVSFLAYQPFLFERWLVPLPLLAIVLCALTAFLVHRVARRLYQSEPPRAPDLGSATVTGTETPELNPIQQ